MSFLQNAAECFGLIISGGFAMVVIVAIIWDTLTQHRCSQGGKHEWEAYESDAIMSQMRCTKCEVVHTIRPIL